MEHKLTNQIKNLFHKYRHGWILSYFFLYMAWFSTLEKAVVHDYHPIHIWLDDLIPFNEYFIIPYGLWFLFIAATILYFFFTSKEDFYKCCAFLFIGMTICLTIYTIWPNGQNLRPTTFARDNLFVDMVRNLYRVDTSTNVFPSIHVFNSIGAYLAISHSNRLKQYRWVKHAALILAVSISFSTVFLKQHSVLDGIAAILLGAFMYAIVYVPDYSRFFGEDTAKEYGFEN